MTTSFICPSGKPLHEGKVVLASQEDLVGGGHPRIWWFHRGQSHLTQCRFRGGLRLLGMLHSIFPSVATHLESTPDTSAACQQPGDYGVHLVQSNLACRGLAANWEVTPS